jgi:hypothetical protein
MSRAIEPTTIVIFGHSTNNHMPCGFVFQKINFINISMEATMVAALHQNFKGQQKKSQTSHSSYLEKHNMQMICTLCVYVHHYLLLLFVKVLALAST